MLDVRRAYVQWNFIKINWIENIKANSLWSEFKCIEYILKNELKQILKPFPNFFPPFISRIRENARTNFMEQVSVISGEFFPLLQLPQFVAVRSQALGGRFCKCGHKGKWRGTGTNWNSQFTNLKVACRAIRSELNVLTCTNSCRQ